MVIISLLGMAFVFAIASAVNAVGTYFAASLAEAEYPDYKQTFLTIFFGYMIFTGIIVLLSILKMTSNFFVFVTWFAVLGWVIYRLVNKLGIEGNKNIIIFIGMSFFFNIIIGAILGMIF